MCEVSWIIEDRRPTYEELLAENGLLKEQVNSLTSKLKALAARIEQLEKLL